MENEDEVIDCGDKEYDEAEAFEEAYQRDYEEE